MLVEVGAAHPQGSGIAAKPADLSDLTVWQDWDIGIESRNVSTTPACLTSSLDVKLFSPSQLAVVGFWWQFGARLIYFRN